MTDNLLQRYLHRSPEQPATVVAPSEAETLDDLGAFGWLRGVRDRAAMLELRKKDGNILAVGYAWLDRVEFDPSIGITLHSGGQTIRLLGRHLNGELRPQVRLFQGICRHRVPWVQEADQLASLATNGTQTVIEKIEW